MRCNQNAFAVRKRSQDWRVCKIPVGTDMLGALLAFGTPASASRWGCVVLIALVRPQHVSRLQVESDDSVRGLGCRFRERIAGGNVDRAEFRIDGRRAPNGCSSGRPKLRA